MNAAPPSHSRLGGQMTTPPSSMGEDKGRRPVRLPKRMDRGTMVQPWCNRHCRGLCKGALSVASQWVCNIILLRLDLLRWGLPQWPHASPSPRSQRYRVQLREASHRRGGVYFLRPRTKRACDGREMRARTPYLTVRCCLCYAHGGRFVRSLRIGTTDGPAGQNSDARRKARATSHVLGAGMDSEGGGEEPRKERGAHRR
jgi:hypothetical protein